VGNGLSASGKIQAAAIVVRGVEVSDEDFFSETFFQTWEGNLIN
jgi:hypothetical protein